MNNVERFENVMNFKPVDRIPMVEWAYWWDETIKRWHSETLPKELTDVTEIMLYFGLDSFRQLWVPPRSESCPEPASHGAPLVSSIDEYIKFKKDGYLYPKNSVNIEMLKKWDAENKEGKTVIWFTVEGFFWHPRTLFGIEPHMYAFYDNPELMHMMNEDVTEFNLQVIEDICSVCKPSFMTFAEDMSYNHGPMLSKQLWDEFIVPYYKKIVPALKERNITPICDSDGDITEVINWLEEVDVEGILPLERMAGVDVAKIRSEHPKFRLLGAFDKTVMHLGEQAIRDEFERLLPTIRTGGFIPSVDHQTPPGVSIDNYRLYVKLLGEYCRKAAS